MNRVVCDTNIYVSAFIFPGGKPDQILNLARQGLLKLFISPFILDEFRRISREKFQVEVSKCDELVERVLKIAGIVEPQIEISVIKEKEDDNRILECAVEARADYLITGDTKHILPLKVYQGIKICSPDEFLRLWARLEMA